MMSDSQKQLSTPVAFVVFNRPEPSRKVFEQIRKARPKTLLLIADGPRESKVGEDEQCLQVIKIVENIDWSCSVYKNYSEVNLGCKKRVSSGLDWVFNIVDRAIVLEDDCLPDESFFRFCEELLEYYYHDERVMQICGSNFLNGWRRDDASYYFSSFGPIWGWASWRRAWEHYDVELGLWPEVRESKVYEDFCLDKEEADFRFNLYEQLYRGDIDTWDYQWGFAKMINSGLSIVPNKNLISNIGFGADATHTISNQLNPHSEMETYNIDFPLIHPKYILRDKISDRKYLDAFVFDKKAKDKPVLHNAIKNKMLKLIQLVTNDK